MAPHRFFAEEVFSSTPDIGAAVVVPLSADDLHRAARTARLRAGERIIIVDVDHRVLECDVLAVSPLELSVIISGVRSSTLEPDVTLYAGLTKGHKMDLTVEKAVEVGVARIVPVQCERSIVRFSGEKAFEKAQRWQRVAASAAAQSQRAFIPEVESPVTLEDVVSRVSQHAVLVVAWESAQAGSLAAVLEPVETGASLGVIVGPEGGFSQEEIDTLEEAGAQVVSLGRNILRSETAGIVLAALTVYEMGGLGGRSRG